MANILVSRRQPPAKQPVVGLRHTLEVGDHGQGEWFRIRADHLTRPSAMNPSMRWLAYCHMNASFSLSRWA